MYKKTIILLFFSLFVFPFVGQAQTEPEDIAMVSDAFQDSFYESLLQKGIENHDKAIIALEKCLVSQPNNATIYFELGKNYLALKQYESAYQSFEKATQIEPQNRWFWVGLYDVSFQTKNYERAMTAIQKLILFDEHYKDDLIPLYLVMNQREKALTLIGEMDAKFGKSQDRNQFKNQILLATKNQPTDWQDVTLFKSYLDANDGNQAVATMYRVIKNNQIPKIVKHRVLNEFLIFSFKNPQYESDFEKVISSFDAGPDTNVAQEVGKFYHNKQQFSKAIYYYELALQKEADAAATTVLLLQAYTATQQYEKVIQKATASLELYPALSQLYFYSGVANNQIGQFKKAKEVLEAGMDYVVDDLDLEINFNLQLAEACNGLKDYKGKETYFAKANQLIQLRKK